MHKERAERCLHRSSGGGQRSSTSHRGCRQAGPTGEGAKKAATLCAPDLHRVTEQALAGSTDQRCALTESCGATRKDCRPGSAICEWRDAVSYITGGLGATGSDTALAGPLSV